MIPNNDPGAELEAWFEHGEGDLPSEGVAVEGREAELKKIQDQQIALQQELLVNPGNADKIIDEMNRLSEVYKDTAGITEVTDEVEPETTGGDLLQTHRELYQAFLRAGDPENPLILSSVQEDILAEMRGISEELAIEAERALMASKGGWHGLDGQELEEMSAIPEDVSDEPGMFDNEEEYESETEPSRYMEMFEEGVPGADSRTIPEMMAAASAAEDALASTWQLTDEEIDAKLRAVANRWVTSGNKADEIFSRAEYLKNDRKELIGFKLAHRRRPRPGGSRHRRRQPGAHLPHLHGPGRQVPEARKRA